MGLTGPERQGLVSARITDFSGDVPILKTCVWRQAFVPPCPVVPIQSKQGCALKRDFQCQVEQRWSSRVCSVVS